jgi:exopolyphosphatase / guanosine-5'-triphosphate,3'-diphosphate pyrophosphatase
MRVGIVDLGSNSSRLLVADVEGDRVAEVDRRTEVTRLGDGVDATGRLDDPAMERVQRVVAVYAEAIARHDCRAATAIMTSAVRDAANGRAFARAIRERHGLEASVLSGDEEAALTFLGAAAGRELRAGAALAVIDVGGGSTELVVGREGAVEAHASLQLGVVRHSERHLHSDPPTAEELEALGDDVRATYEGALPESPRRAVEAGVAVAGTPTSAAAMELELEPYDRTRVEGHVLERATLAEQLARLAGMTVRQRRQVAGLHPDRAPTVVAGLAILLEGLHYLALERVTVSERDILHGAAVALAARAAA